MKTRVFPPKLAKPIRTPNENSLAGQFCAKTGLFTLGLEQRSGGAFGIPDRMIAIDGQTILVEFKVGELIGDTPDKTISFSQKHGFKPSQIEFIRRFQKHVQPVGVVVMCPIRENKKLVRYRHFFRYAPPHFFLRKWKRGWHIGELTEVTPETFADVFREAKHTWENRHFLDLYPDKA